jgi:circadian clock protein KaiB
MMAASRRTTEKLEKLLVDRKRKEYVLRLYVAGTTMRSARAIANVKEICEQYLHGSYRLEVIDLYQQPHLAHDEQIIAAPTLIKQLPLPVRRVLGDMSKTERVLVVLGLAPKPDAEPHSPDELH